MCAEDNQTPPPLPKVLYVTDHGVSKPATIYDVARDAGVSISTVSNVLNKPDRVAKSTRRKVLEVADTLGYLPKATATELARKQVGRIGVVAPFSTYPSYLRRLVGVMQATRGQQVDISLLDRESAATASSPWLDSLPIRGLVDGLIVMGAPIEEATEARLASRGMPVVVIDTDSSRFSVVNIDDHGAGRQAARHLLELGHRRIGYLLEQQASDYESQARRRLGGFKAELSRHPDVSLQVTQAPGTMADARVAALALLSGPDRPTAVMAHFDDLALGVVHAAAELGLAVPGQLSVLGFDDGPAAEAAGLSTVRQPFEESGAVATGLLLEAITGQQERRVTLLDCRIVERTTTAPPA
jgi:DNA-binding LacI/PurR family transcriptional regulator